MSWLRTLIQWAAEAVRVPLPRMGGRRPRVLMADDHTMLVDGLRLVLEPYCEIVGIVADGRSLIVAAGRLQPDVIITDISMPLLNGIDAVAQIKKATPSVKVIFLTMHADVDYATRALEVGGSGFVLKSSAADELIVAIQASMAGQRYVTSVLPESVREVLMSGATHREQLADHLSMRQREVLQLVAEGKTMKEIGGILHLSPRTVEFHKYQLMKELGLRTTGELTQYAVKHGITGK